MADDLRVCATPGCGEKFPPCNRGSEQEYCTKKCRDRTGAKRAYQKPHTITDAMRKKATSVGWKSPDKCGRFRFHDCACGAVYVLEFRWNIQFGPQFRMLSDGREPRSESEKKIRWTNVRVPPCQESRGIAVSETIRRKAEENGDQ